MAVTVTVTQLKGSKFLHKASHLYVTPWVEPTSGNWQLGTDTWDVVQVLADSVNIEQADPESETRDWEFGDTPLMSSVTMGDITFSATCIDMSSDILQKVFGWNYLGGTSASPEIVYSPDSYSDVYATIAITFEDGNSPIIVLPKVLMSSKATIASLKTSTAEATLSGTCLSAYIGYGTSSPAALSTARKSTPYCFVNPVDQNEIWISDSVNSTSLSIGEVDTTNGKTSLITHSTT